MTDNQKKGDAVGGRQPDGAAPGARNGILVTCMRAEVARDFLLKPESYCDVEFPAYINFGPVLEAVAKQMRGKRLSEVSEKARDHEGINYRILWNKDGRYAWRPYELIHPALYVSLVEMITDPKQWEFIQNRFREFRKASQIESLGIPLHSPWQKKEKAGQILHWWQEIEQASIELALEYHHVFHADITDCYAAIYTHSISWALHGKEKAKKNRNGDVLIGNAIDRHIRDMRNGQTNGIPQGSVLMHLIAEMVLGYADLELAKAITKAKITKYRILRYRDDYRIFVNDTRAGEEILKKLTEVLSTLGMKLNAAKTRGSSQVVASSIKADKRAWMRGTQWHRDIQMHLLIIHSHAEDFPNSGSVVNALTRFHQRISRKKIFRNVRSLVSIAADIAYGSPRALPLCAAIISKLLTAIDSEADRIVLIEKIHAKLSQMPNTGHMEVWLQRISHPYRQEHNDYKETLCKIVDGLDRGLWRNEWITCKKLRAALDRSKIVDKPKLDAIKPVIEPEEIALFNRKWHPYY